MKNLRLKLAAVMVGTTVVILLLAIFAINFFSQRMIFDQVDNELVSEAEYYKNFNKPYNFEEKRLFEILSVYLDENDYYIDEIENDYDQTLNYFTYEERLFFEKYFKGELKEDEVTRIRTEDGDYYALLIRVYDDSPFMMNVEEKQKDVFAAPELDDYASAEIAEDVTLAKVNDDDASDDNARDSGEVIAQEDELYMSNTGAGAQDNGSLVVLFTDVGITSNIVDLLNMIFIILLFVAIIVEGVVGLLMGKSLEDSQRKMRYFFQNASHELKSPLMSVQGYAEGIQQGVVNDAKAASEVIIKKSERMRKLIDEMLMLSKLDSNAYIFNSRELDIRNIIDDSVDNFDILVKQKSLDVTLDYEDTNAIVIGDELQLYKAYNTVIDNAFKFAETTVCIKSTIKGKLLTTTIYNDGTPIDATDLEHIFDRFYSGNHISTGIGLAMAREIIKQSRGELSAKNNPYGVTFTINLPLARKVSKCQ